MTLSRELRHLVGKKVVAIRLNPFNPEPDNPRCKWRAFDPEITFSDGSSMKFVAQETEVGEYGIAPVVYKPEGRCICATLPHRHDCPKGRA